MWDYDGFLGKAELYFLRGREHPRADDDVLALWLLLGLEFLMRAPLAKVHPSLLADPTGDAVMYAAGFPVKPDSPQPKSILTKTVILRLGVVIPDFDKERQDDATFLTSLRNQELHASDSPLEIDIAKWLPQFTRVVDVICAYLELDSGEIVGEDLITQGRALVDKEDKRLEREVEKRIEAAKIFYAHLRPEEIEARTQMIPKPLQYRRQAPLFPAGISVTDAVAAVQGAPKFPAELITCPGCGNKIPMQLRAIRATNERLEDDEIVHDVVYIAVELSCPVCDLQLLNTAEIRAAKIEQQYVRQESESIEDRFLSTWEPDYGND